MKYVQGQSKRQQNDVSWWLILNIFHLSLAFVLLTLNWKMFAGIPPDKRQKGKALNGGNKKTKHANFSEKRTFLTHWYAHVREISPFALSLTKCSKNQLNSNLFTHCNITCPEDSYFAGKTSASCTCGHEMRSAHYSGWKGSPMKPTRQYHLFAG